MSTERSGLATHQRMSYRRKKLFRGVRRVFTPAWFVSVYYLLRCRSKISMRAEVEINPNLQLGADCWVGSFAKIKSGDGVLSIGDRARIATGCFIASGAANLMIGRNFIAGPHVRIVASNYRHHQKNMHLEDLGSVSRGITIGHNVWIGGGTTVTDGSQIGDNTIVVANSLVNRKFPPDVILQGNPARIIARR